MSVKLLIKKVEAIPLDCEYILGMIGHRPRIRAMLYDELKKYKTLHDLFHNDL